MSEARNPPVVVIIGGGASGTIVAIRLLESAAAKSGKLRIVLIERKPSFGRGVAYGTEAPFHLLNVRQNRMSVFEEDADHFSRWIGRISGTGMKEAFQPRFRYAEYLASTLNDARRAAPAAVFRSIAGEATRFDRKEGCTRVHLLSGESFVADRLVVATGYRPPEVSPELRSVARSTGFIEDPWAVSRNHPIRKDESILVLGSGLTAVDFVLSQMRSGHLGRIDVLSRRGLSPLPHPAKAIGLTLKTPFPDESVRGVFRGLRVSADSAGDRWSEVVDAFRPEIHRVWGNWNDSERRRFLRHVRSYWEVHRHRVAPEVFREWDLYRRGGKIRLEAGRILSAAEGRDGFDVEIARRGGVVEKRRYDRIVNCTGVSPDLTLFADQDYQSDPLNIGIPTDLLGRPYFGNGSIDPEIYVVGPALRTRFWEMTAVPEIRIQAKAVVDSILLELD